MGIHRVRLADFGVRLALGKQYRWFVQKNGVRTCFLSRTDTQVRPFNQEETGPDSVQGPRSSLPIRLLCRRLRRSFLQLQEELLLKARPV
jgi:hypothetical protein